MDAEIPAALSTPFNSISISLNLSIGIPLQQPRREKLPQHARHVGHLADRCTSLSNLHFLTSYSILVSVFMDMDNGSEPSSGKCALPDELKVSVH